MPLGAPGAPDGKFPLNNAVPGVAPGAAAGSAPGVAVAPAPPSAVASPVAPPTPVDSPSAGPTPVDSPPAGPTPVDSPPAPIAVEPVPSCPTPKPTPVTGASLGLQLTYDGSGAGAEILVPSWLFTIEGSTSPTPVIAIDPAYLAGPDDSPGGGTTAVEPNSAPPASPPVATPLAGKDLPSPTK